MIQVFKRNDLPVNNIHWGVKDKVSKCIELGIDFMIEDNPSTCKLLQSKKIKTLYFRDKDNEIIKESEYLKEVSNVGEICRCILNINGLKNNQDVYERILRRQNVK